MKKSPQFEEESEELGTFDEEEGESEEVENDELEKDFEVVFAEENKVYFLETNGGWWCNTFKTNETAKIVANGFNHG